LVASKRVDAAWPWCVEALGSKERDMGLTVSMSRRRMGLLVSEVTTPMSALCWAWTPGVGVKNSDMSGFVEPVVLYNLSPLLLTLCILNS
jgi:hypothetical protein